MAILPRTRPDGSQWAAGPLPAFPVHGRVPYPSFPCTDGSPTHPSSHCSCTGRVPYPPSYSGPGPYFLALRERVPYPFLPPPQAAARIRSRILASGPAEQALREMGPLPISWQ